MTNYIVALLTTSGIYALLALGLNVTWGMTGIANFGLAGFFALGAYASGILATAAGVPIPLAVAGAVVVGGLCGAVVSLGSVRLRGDYLAIVTFAFTEVVRLVASNEIWLTNGTDGISGIPGLFRGIVTPSQYNWISLAAVGALVVVSVAICNRLSDSPYGRALRAIRDDEVVASVAGKDTAKVKLQAFVIGACFMALGGAAYAHFQSYIAPDIFGSIISVYAFLALTMGGSGNNYGAVLGAIVLIVLLEGSRFVVQLIPGIGAVQAAAFREILVGIALIATTRFAPQGFLRERRPSY